MDNYNLIKRIHTDIQTVDRDTGGRLKLVKAFYLKGMTSVLENGQLVEAISDINLETACLVICDRNKDLSLATHDARETGKRYARTWLSNL